MSFLQPLALIALPLIALPIIIHLINQQRHRTVPWAAMMFLMRAKRMSRGMARLRHLLILLMRVLAIAALIFAISRPLSGGWLGSVGLSKPDATLVLLDRSASMEVQDLQAGESKRSTALKRLAQLLEQGDYGTHLLLIDSASGQLQEVDSPKVLLSLPVTEPSATSANIPAMLETALAYLKANESGRAEIWICSDLKENDWDVHSGRWNAIREEFTQLEGAHLFLLAYADPPSSNLSVRVENVQRWERGNDAELVLDVIVRTEGGFLTGAEGRIAARRVPIEFEVNNVRSVVEVELDTLGASLKGHRIPIDAKLSSGWGSVSLPGDANPLDNRFFFVFSEPPVRKAVVVSDDAKVGETFRRALAIPTDVRIQHHVDVIPMNRVAEIDWENTGLLIWQGTLPSGLVAEQVQHFVNNGRVAMFFPSKLRTSTGTGDQLFAARWGGWQSTTGEQSDTKGDISWWRGDTDLLAHAEGGDALPLSELRTYQYRDFESQGTLLARFDNDAPLLTRVATDQGAAYFCSTLPTAQFSSLERDGVVFYVMLQRALAEGSQTLAVASQRDAEIDVLADRNQWEPVAPTENSSISQRGLHAGVYRDEGYWAAINRSQIEDNAKTASLEAVDGLFDGLSYRRIDVNVGDTSALASELWRIFLIAMAVVLMLEAVLSLPSRKTESTPLMDLAVAEGTTE
ncbi:BatA domain-containing protein [Candidatus Poribacteria bacterium]|nr:BatA domain-containing protein [Candidatus Poribacteria bacterium]